jgi:hypothetical protein
MSLFLSQLTILHLIYCLNWPFNHDNQIFFVFKAISKNENIQDYVAKFEERENYIHQLLLKHHMDYTNFNCILP